MIIVITELKFQAGNEENYIEALEFLNGPLSSREGLIRSEIFHPRAKKSFFRQDELVSLIIYEEWISTEQFEDYVKSSVYKQILSLSELSVVSPRVRIIECGSVKGFTWIENIILKNKDSAVENIA